METEKKTSVAWLKEQFERQNMFLYMQKLELNTNQ